MRESLDAVRAAVGAHATPWGLPEPKVDRLLVAASELASDAAPGHTRSTCALKAAAVCGCAGSSSTV
ncbi:hypothetical protein [Dactylosporangium matsuzakiense]|uniref:Uncharacterized protein n=1 Tax=Dactylosporangium matsuzakiense TaxID=53360 RepID=A0A9W6NSL6_9ACTN|nr:hypothetical protein [Dactylosporangium matsuzakiense]GLL07769.1 hypothetical protein GCM10017581_095260 [Dactylosporangium matsuzakiense]